MEVSSSGDDRTCLAARSFSWKLKTGLPVRGAFPVWNVLPMVSFSNHLPCRTVGVVEWCRLWVEPHSPCCIEAWKEKDWKPSAV
jgi:hypothetical protein